jgi:hypothetical protein
MERFWSKVVKRGSDECWEWQAAKNKGGYGKLGQGGLTKLAHRVAWELVHGPIPSGLWRSIGAITRLVAIPATCRSGLSGTTMPT